MKPGELEKRIYELVGYMITSGRNLLNETPAYGPFRLVDAVSRLTAILEEGGLASPRLLRLREAIERGKYSVMESQEALREFLEGLVYIYVEQLEATEGGDG